MKFECTVCGYVYEGDFVPNTCPVCGNDKLIEQDFYTLQELKCSQQLIEAMQKLRNSDIIEYELKMSQFRNQLEQKRANERARRQQQTQNMPKCPTCGSTNIQKISAPRKAAGAIGFGLFSKTACSQFECLDCKYKW